MLTSHELFGFMSPNLADEIITFTFESDKPVYRATLNAVAQARHLRPVFLERQPKTQRHAAMIATLVPARAGFGRGRPDSHLAAEKAQGHARGFFERAGD
jgi:hypothetical protein